MARSKIDCHSWIFKNLVNLAIQAGLTSESALSEKRWISTTESDLKWLLDCKVEEPAFVTPTIQICRLTFNNSVYLVVVGDVPCSVAGDLFSKIEVNPGIFTALCFELSLSPTSSSPLDIVEYIIPLYKVEGDDLYNGHPMEIVRKYFPTITIYSIEEGSVLLDWSVIRLGGYFFSSFANQFTLNFSRKVRDAVATTLLECNTVLPCDNLLSALFQVHWKNSFMDVYRCIESVFFVPFMEKLSAQISSPMELDALCKAVEDCTGWRAKEKDAMERIFDAAPSDKLSGECLRVRKKLTNIAGGKMGEWFYDIRNSVVHHRPALNSCSWDDEQWDDLLLCLIIATKDSFPAPSALEGPSA